MSLDLIYDRTESDVNAADDIRAKYQALMDWSGLTDAEISQLERGTLTNVTLNRVEAAVQTLAAELNAAGYAVAVDAILKGHSGIKLELDSNDFQQAPYLYATGVHDTTYSDGYISTINDYSVYNEAIIVSANINLGSDSGFLWYDENGSFISGAVAANINGSTMSAMPPDGADYCKFNINATGITPSSISTVVLTLRSPEEYADREWRESDIVRLSQWRQYLANVQALRDAYYTLAETGELPDAADRLDYIGANTIEKILADIDLLIDWMKSSYRRCGTFRAGNNAAHLPLKGSI